MKILKLETSSLMSRRHLLSCGMMVFFPSLLKMIYQKFTKPLA